jgi:hypothetical protein
MDLRRWVVVRADRQMPAVAVGTPGTAVQPGARAAELEPVPQVGVFRELCLATCRGGRIGGNRVWESR